MILKLRFVKLKNGCWIKYLQGSVRAHDLIAEKELELTITDEILEGESDAYNLTPIQKPKDI